MKESMSITVRNDTTGTLSRQISEDVLETTDEEESVSEYAETSVSEYAETSDSEEESELVSAKMAVRKKSKKYLNNWLQ